jgi:hypothetical protein
MSQPGLPAVLFLSETRRTIAAQLHSVPGFLATIVTTGFRQPDIADVAPAEYALRAARGGFVAIVLGNANGGGVIYAPLVREYGVLDQTIVSSQEPLTDDTQAEYRTHGIETFGLRFDYAARAGELTVPGFLRTQIAMHQQ